jgi:hypothetical protein
MSDSVPWWRRLYQGWLRVAAAFGEAQTLVIVALTYAVVIGPMAVAMRAGRGDPLAKRPLGSTATAWREADSTAKPDLARAKRLF